MRTGYPGGIGAGIALARSRSLLRARSRVGSASRPASAPAARALVVLLLQEPFHALDRLLESRGERRAAGVDDQDRPAGDVGDDLDAVLFVLALEQRAHRDDPVVELYQVLELLLDLLAGPGGIVVVKDRDLGLHADLRARF